MDWPWANYTTIQCKTFFCIKGFSQLLRNNKIGVVDDISDDSYAMDIFNEAFILKAFYLETRVNFMHNNMMVYMKWVFPNFAE